MSPDQAQRTCQNKITYAPNQARKTRQIRLEKHAKAGSNCTPKQARKTRQIRLKLHAKSGSNYTPNQAQITRQIRLKLRAKSGSSYTPNYATNTRCMLKIRSKKERKETRTRLSVPASFAAQERQLT